MIVYKRRIDVSAGSVPIIISLSQRDTNARIMLDITSGDGVLTLVPGTTVQIAGTRPDKTAVTVDAALDIEHMTVTADVPAQMTMVSGRSLYELVFTYNNKEFHSSNFIICVERAA